jgi:chromosome segregation ATPase
MNDLTELERRVAAALDRIATHVEHLERPAPVSETAQSADDDLPPAAELMADLEAERAVTAQLEERVRAIKDKQDNQVGILQSDLTLARDRIATLEQENAALRDEISAGSGDGGDAAALEAELKRLRAEREEERAELAALLAELKPIVEEGASA